MANDADQVPPAGAPDTTDEPRSTEDTVYRLAFIITMLVATGLAAIFFYIDDTTNVKQKLSSVGTGLAASVIFALLFTYFGNRQFNDLIKTTIQTSQTRGNQKLVGQVKALVDDIRETQRLYLPSSVYSPTPGFDASFNADIMRDLRNSSTYLFRGSSGKYVPIRINSLSKRGIAVRLVLANPASKASIARRAHDRRANPKYAGKSEQELVAALQTEVMRNIVALYDIRHLSSIEVGFVDFSPAVTRLELFDDACYLSIHTSPHSTGNAFPETIRFEKPNFLFETYRMEANRQFDDAAYQIRFSPNDGVETLLEHFAHLGMSSQTEATINELRATNESFAVDFRRHLEHNGYK